MTCTAVTAFTCRGELCFRAIAMTTGRRVTYPRLNLREREEREMAREIAYVSPGRLVVDGTASDVRCHVATGFFDRLLGLMGQPEIATSEMMVFPRCRSVHTFWMRVRIDVAWLGEPDADGVMPVVGLAPSL